MLRNLIIVALMGLTIGTILRENVVFRKVKEVTTSRSKWLVTFVLDLEPYSEAIVDYSKDLRSASNKAWKAVSVFRVRGQMGSTTLLRAMITEIEMLQEMQRKLVGHVAEFHSLTRKEKRSLLPFVGNALHFLFGTVSDSDFRKVSKGIKELGRTQEQIRHVVNESITMLNVSRMAIIQNRQSINEVVKGLRVMDARFKNVTGALEGSILEIEHFMQTYVQLSLVIADLRRMLQQAIDYFTELKAQINALALGRLSPSLLSPYQLRSLLLEVQSQLSPPLHLPSDPRTDLWQFYQYLTCNTVMLRSKILVVVPIPLLDTSRALQIYRIHNLPVPLTNGSNLVNQGDLNLVARFDLESQGFAIDARRTKFAMLTDVELDGCSRPLISFCAIHSPFYPVNLNRFCVVALFMNDKDEIRTNCNSHVRSDSILPIAEYLTDGVWAISTKEKLDVAITCEHQNTYNEIISPPLEILKLKTTCTGTNKLLFLPAYYERESQVEIRDFALYNLSQRINFNISLWEPFYKAIPEYANIPLPKKLGAIKEIPMDRMIRELQAVGATNKEEGLPSWFYVMLAGITVLLVGLIGVIIYVKWMAIKTTMSGFLKDSGLTVPGMEMVSVNAEGEGHADGEGQHAVSTPSSPADAAEQTGYTVASVSGTLLPIWTARKRQAQHL